MSRTLVLAAALLLTVCSVQITSAQFKIPRIPKPTQPKPEPSSAPETPSTAPTQPNQPTSARAMNQNDGQPRIEKDTVLLTTQRGRDVGGYEAHGWVPAIQYRGTGNIPSGSRMSVDFMVAGKPWVSFDCTPERETEESRSWSASCGGDSIPGGKQVTYAGPVAFTIHLRNELQGTNVTLFNGTAKVVMVPASKAGLNNEEWYVDEDWRIPFGYVFWEKDSGHGNDDFLHVAFWVRGNTPEVEAHLFYQGKDIAKFSKPGNGAADWNPNLHRWGLIDGEFLGVYPNAPGGDEGYPPRFGLRNNPGNYEVKVLILGHLARSIKFQVSGNGSLVGGVDSANTLGTDRVVVPVQVLGDSSGTWDRNAWKTDAFYGNPLAGFVAP